MPQVVRILVPILTALLTSVATISVAYLQFAPGAAQTAASRTDSELNRRVVDVDTLKANVAELEKRTKGIPDVAKLDQKMIDLGERIKRAEANAADLRLPSDTEIDVPLGKIRRNTWPRPVLIVGGCNASLTVREIEALLGANQQAMTVVSSVTGSGRITLTLVVPSGYYYNVRQTLGAAPGCDFRGWRI
jgi:hypothetical protein